METTHSLLTRLAIIPVRISRAVEGLDEVQLHTRPSSEAWSAADVFAHLRASDDIVAPRIYILLVRDNPFMAAYDELRWADVAGYSQANVRASLTVFTLRRAEIVAMLRHITPDDWQRTGVHEALGSMSLLTMLTGFVGHEEEHCVQIEAIHHH